MVWSCGGNPSILVLNKCQKYGSGHFNKTATEVKKNPSAAKLALSSSRVQWIEPVVRCNAKRFVFVYILFFFFCGFSFSYISRDTFTRSCVCCLSTLSQCEFVWFWIWVKLLFLFNLLLLFSQFASNLFNGRILVLGTFCVLFHLTFILPFFGSYLILDFVFLFFRGFPIFMFFILPIPLSAHFFKYISDQIA